MSYRTLNGGNANNKMAPGNGLGVRLSILEEQKPTLKIYLKRVSIQKFSCLKI
jgi:hypothetical protein